MDLSNTVAPTSDQLDAVDLLGGPRTFTIKGVRKGNAEQPVQVDLVEFPRPWRPGKSMRRVLLSVWGKDTDAFAGRRITLYCDPRVQFGGQAVGGTRISAMSHIDEEKEVPLLISRGKAKVYKVQPLTDDEPQGGASSGGITPDHERVIREHMQRTGLTGEDVLASARAVAGRDITTARELSATEADQLITVLADVPNSGEA